MKRFQILHLSDFHIKAEDGFDRSVVLDPLIERVSKDRDNGFDPEIVVVSGDIAYKGIDAEYKQAGAFFEELLRTLELTSDRLFIVPGNHDVNRKKYRPKDIPIYDNVGELNLELEDEDYRSDLFKGMGDYFGFISNNYPHLKSGHGNLVPFVHLYESRCKKKIGLVGLNSAWMCRRSPDEGEIAIGEYQVAKAMEELKELGEFDQLIHIFHHPVSWLWSEDRSRIRHFLNDSIVLNGHLHDAAGGCSMDPEYRLYQYQAGRAYLGSEFDSPARDTTI